MRSTGAPVAGPQKNANCKGSKLASLSAYACAFLQLVCDVPVGMFAGVDLLRRRGQHATISTRHGALRCTGGSRRSRGQRDPTRAATLCAAPDLQRRWPLFQARRHLGSGRDFYNRCERRAAQSGQGTVHGRPWLSTGRIAGLPPSGRHRRAAWTVASSAQPECQQLRHSNRWRTARGDQGMTKASDADKCAASTT